MWIRKYITQPQPKPGQRVEIDHGHPLANGLVFDAIFNEGGGQYVRDLVTGTYGIGNSSHGWHPNGTNISGTSYWEFSNIPDTGLLWAITLIWRGNIRTGGDYRHFMGKHGGNGAINNVFDYRTDNSATPLLTLVRSDGGTNSVTGPAVTLGQFKTYAVSDPRGNAPTPIVWAIDGIEKGTSASENIARIASNSPLRIGRRADGAVQMDGICEYAKVYRRALTKDQLAWSHVEPYAHIKTVPARTYFLPLGGTTVDYSSLTSQLGVIRLGTSQLGMVSTEPVPTPPVVDVPWGWYVPLSEAAPAKIEVVSY